MKKTLLRGGRIVDSSAVKPADVLIGVTGNVEAIGNVQDHKDADVVDCSGKLLFPLLIDCHVHFREPGLTHKATMQSESAAALAAGIGCVCEMPNTIPPTVTVAALADKVRRAEDVDGVVLRFYFGVTEEAHLHALRELWSGSSMELKRLKHHCSGLKLYLDHSTGNQKVDGGIVDEIFATCAELTIPLVAHCEDSEMNAAAKAAHPGTDIALHSLHRPPESEAKSIEEAVARVRKHGTALHIAHLSTAKGLALVRKAKAEKLPVTCEVSPHHLFLSIDDYQALGTLGKMNPPLRSPSDCDALWAGIRDGAVDCIATDHAPHTLEEKKSGEPLSVPSGVPGVETMLPLLLTEAAKKNGRIAYSDIVRLCLVNPNRIFNLGQHTIEVKAPARIVVVDPSASCKIEAASLQGKSGWTPFEGRSVTGKVARVIAH